MGKFIDLTGKRFGRLIVLKRMNNNEYGKLYWLCRCDCGKEKTVRGSDIKNGKIKSCGCLWGKAIKHGRSQNDKTYQSWDAMIQRCTNPKNIGYKNYGGRGINVCEEWLKFENFLKDMGERPEGYYLDRINNNKGYYKENCRWITKKEQSRNRRNNWLVPFDNRILCIAEWAEETGINAQTIRSRLIHHWSPQKALTTPVRKRNK